jgi:uncharacterized tellurite resistance protein B-like protein
MNWDKIAKTGSFTDMYGNKRTLTKALFEEIAANYQKAAEKAPAVFGHPSTAAPAQGWIGELRVNGDYLEARYEDIKPEARAVLESKEYRYKSMSYDPKTNTLQHVGFLGAVAPAIPGLGEIAFAENEKGVTLYFSRYFDVKDFKDVELESKKGGSKMDEATMKLIAEAQAAVKEKEAKIAELQAQLAKQQEELKALTEGKTAAEKQVEEAKKETETVKAEFASAARLARVDALVASGKLTPAERDKTLKMAETLGANNTASFATADGKTMTAEEQYLRDLEARDASELLGSFSKPAGAGEGDSKQNASADVTKYL